MPALLRLLLPILAGFGGDFLTRKGLQTPAVAKLLGRLPGPLGKGAASILPFLGFGAAQIGTDILLSPEKESGELPAKEALGRLKLGQESPTIRELQFLQALQREQEAGNLGNLLQEAGVDIEGIV